MHKNNRTTPTNTLFKQGNSHRAATIKYSLSAIFYIAVTAITNAHRLHKPAHITSLHLQLLPVNGNRGSTRAFNR